MLAGTPVIATRGGGVGEVVEAGETEIVLARGFLVAVEQKLAVRLVLVIGVARDAEVARLLAAGDEGRQNDQPEPNGGLDKKFTLAGHAAPPELTSVFYTSLVRRQASPSRRARSAARAG